MEDFIKAVLEDPETFGKFIIKSYTESKYKEGVFIGKAQDRTGMTHIGWMTDGHGVTYFGGKLEPNITVTIGKDGGTRYAFNGYCHTREDFERVLKLTW